MNKIYDGSESDVFNSSENQESRTSLRADNELFNEEDSTIVHPVINIKRKESKTSEDWEVRVDGDLALVMKGARFTNSEREFLRTVHGMKFLISEYKNGKKSVVKIKEELRKFL